MFANDRRERGQLAVACKSRGECCALIANYRRGDRPSEINGMSNIYEMSMKRSTSIVILARHPQCAWIFSFQRRAIAAAKFVGHDDAISARVRPNFSPARRVNHVPLARTCRARIVHLRQHRAFLLPVRNAHTVYPFLRTFQLTSRPSRYWRNRDVIASEKTPWSNTHIDAGTTCIGMYVCCGNFFSFYQYRSVRRNDHYVW